MEFLWRYGRDHRVQSLTRVEKNRRCDLTRESWRRVIHTAAILVLNAWTHAARSRSAGCCMVVGLPGSGLAGDLSARQSPPGQTGYGLTTMLRDHARTLHVRGRLGRPQLPAEAGHHPGQERRPEAAVTGFWQGMSGSPLFIEDKLICAFSYGFRFNKVALGGCTPLEYMKKDGLDSYRRARRASADGRRTEACHAGRRRRWPTGSASRRRVDPQAAMDALGPAHKQLAAVGAAAGGGAQAGADRRPVDAGVGAALGAGFLGAGVRRAREDVRRLRRHAERASGAGGGGEAARRSSRWAARSPSSSFAATCRPRRSARCRTSTATTCSRSATRCSRPARLTCRRDRVLAHGGPVVAERVLDGVAAHRDRLARQDRQAAITADTNLRAPMIPMDITVDSRPASTTRAVTFTSSSSTTSS